MPKTKKTADMIDFLNAAYDGTPITIQGSEQAAKIPKWAEQAKRAGWVPPRPYLLTFIVAVHPSATEQAAEAAIEALTTAVQKAVREPIIRLEAFHDVTEIREGKDATWVTGHTTELGGTKTGA